jgi:5'-methylthioadenosine phosphorylase
VTRLGVIGGSGLYSVDQLTDVDSVRAETPFGDPSDLITTGRHGQHDVAFIPRHGTGHTLAPTEVPYRANIYALKHLGVTHLLSISAVGSLTEAYPPLTLVCPDQIIDRTVFRDRTFFDGGIVAHVGLAEPFCGPFTDLIVERAAGAGVTVARGGAYVCIEGPQFSTKAESALYRSWGASVIGMTAMPEARLAREAELCYAQISMVTDFDVWHETSEPVSVDAVIARLHETTAAANRVLRAVLSGELSARSECGCENALEHAIVTASEQISDEQRQRLAGIAGRYLTA